MNRTIGPVFIALSTAALLAGCVGDPDAVRPAATPDDVITASKPGGAPVVLSSIGAPTTPGLAAAYVVASRNADAFVASRPALLQVSPHDAFVQGSVASSDGIFYVPYERTYAGLPVVGGDFVTVIDGAGQIAYHSTALERPIDLASITPAMSRAAAETIATRRLRSVTRVEGTQLVVNALGATPRLAWESTVNGFGANGISRLTVDIDALTGAVLREQEHVLYGSGTSAWNGPNALAINTVQQGTTFLMRDPTITNLSCQDAANNTTFSGADDVWGNGDATNRETGCVDALFGAQTEARMLSQWLGRNAMDGAGGAWPIRVGLADVNAFYDGTQVQVGHNNANQWIGALDVIAHEMGHGIDDHTPGGISGNGTQEFVADAFGAATEWFANEPAPFDVPDFTVGEQINLVGSGPIRNMANPSAIGDPNCYSSSIPSTEVHAAAGPGNHWFYLLAQGSNPTNGQPTSPTCNSSTVVGLGVQNATKIMYSAMLMKTTASSYLKYRTWTLQAAINLFPGSCTQFNTVKAAWDAVSVPAQAADPICGGGGGIPGAGLHLWLRADAGIVPATGSQIARWMDQSGNGRNASMATVARQPSLVGGALNGQPVVRFFGAQSLVLEVPSTPTRFSVFVVGKNSMPSESFSMILGAAGSTPNNQLRWENGSQALFVTHNAGTIITSPIGNTRIYHALSARYDGTAITWYRDGNAMSSRAYTATAPWTIAQVGAWFSSNFLVGDLAEVIIYDRAVSEAERASVNAYLRSKYGLP